MCALMMYLQAGLASLLLFTAVSQQGQRTYTRSKIDTLYRADTADNLVLQQTPKRASSLLSREHQLLLCAHLLLCSSGAPAKPQLGMKQVPAVPLISLERSGPP